MLPGDGVDHGVVVPDRRQNQVFTEHFAIDTEALGSAVTLLLLTHRQIEAKN